jgi:hypothetical protein
MLSRRCLSCIALVALASLAHAADVTALPALHTALFKRAMAAPPVASGSPADIAAFFLSGWMLTGDEACRRAAQEHLTRSHGHVNRDGLYEASGVGGRAVIPTRATVDHLLAYWVADKLLDNHALRVHLDRCADGMMRNLARQPVKAANGQSYMLFAPEYETAKPYRAAARAGISPECNAATGLVFTLLYHDGSSKWFHDGTVGDIALNELHASMTTQRLQSGAVFPGEPAAEAQADPAIGAAALFAWSWANQLWREPETEVRIRRAVDWLDPLFDGQVRDGRWTPEGQGMTTRAMWQVFAALADHGRDLRRLVSMYEASLADGNATPVCGQAYLYLMGLPTDVLQRTGLSGKWLPVVQVGG